MRNTAIYTQLHAAHSSRIVKIDGADIEQYSQQSIGAINGQYRSLPAIVSSGVAPDDQWVIINLTDSRSGHGLHAVACSDEYMDGRYVGSIAVLGALDDAQAKIWALRQFGQAYGANSASVVRDVSPQAIKLLLDNPASAEGLAISSSTLRKFEGRVTLTGVIWNGGLLKSPERSVDLIHQMQILDTDSQLLDAMSASDMPMLLNELDAVEAEYDALIVEYGSGDGSGINLLMQRLNTAMHKASIGKVKPINVTTTKPFKRNGVTNVAVLFEFDDGQSVTLVFHNPDSTPGKLTSSDILTSWKIMLNKRDVTAALSPKEGDNVQLPDLAKRILLVVEKNSARFQRANAKKTEDIAALGDAQARVESKKSILAGKLGEIDSLEKAIDGAARQAPVVEPVTSTREAVFAELQKSGWKVEGDSILKSYSEMAESDEISSGIRTLTASFDSKERYLAVTDNDAPTGGKIIASTEIDMRDYGYTADGYINGAQAFNAKVEAYVFQRRVELRRNAERALREKFREPLHQSGLGIEDYIFLRGVISSIVKPTPSEKSIDENKVKNILAIASLAPEIKTLADQAMIVLDSYSYPPTATAEDVAYVKSVVNGSEDLTTAEAIAAVNTEILRIAALQAKNPNPDLDGWLTRAIDIANNAKPTEKQTEEPEMAKSNPDAEFFQAIIDGTIDPLTVDMDHVIELAEKHEGNAAMEVLVDQALEAINQAEQAAAQAV